LQYDSALGFSGSSRAKYDTIMSGRYDDDSACSVVCYLFVNISPLVYDLCEVRRTYCGVPNAVLGYVSMSEGTHIKVAKLSGECVTGKILGIQERTKLVIVRIHRGRLKRIDLLLNLV